MPNPIEIIVWVTGKDVFVSQDEIHISSKKGHEVQWRCYQGDLEIAFKESPFQGDRFRSPRGGACSTGVLKAETAGRRYKYTVIVRIRDDEPLIADPWVVVDD